MTRRLISQEMSSHLNSAADRMRTAIADARSAEAFLIEALGSAANEVPVRQRREFERQVGHMLTGLYVSQFDFFPSDLKLMIERVRELHLMPYREYLQTPEWAARRDAVLRGAGHRCQRCHQIRVELHVHHLTYARRGAELPTDLTCLCVYCHDEEHREQRQP